jgi:hypothetical protein
MARHTKVGQRGRARPQPSDRPGEIARPAARSAESQPYGETGILEPLLKEDGERHNEVSASVGGVKVRILWPSHCATEIPHFMEDRARRQGWPPLRRPFVIGAMSFVLGALLTAAIVWELEPYIETTRVLGEMAALKVGGGVCVVVGTVLYFLRRLIHR